MPKLKSNRGACKRFRVSASGRIKHRKANRNHILTKKAPKRKLQLRSNVAIAQPDVRSVVRSLRGS
ncbi:MAG: 50S ribosomal protein L35 [Gammaproteobacteria bacterium]|nr:50S ribosomal protein L35 [Gammaproteobacteria bacterium]